MAPSSQLCNYACDIYLDLIKVIKELKFTDSPFPNSLLS